MTLSLEELEAKLSQLDQDVRARFGVDLTGHEEKLSKLEQFDAFDFQKRLSSLEGEHAQHAVKLDRMAESIEDLTDAAAVRPFPTDLARVDGTVLSSGNPESFPGVPVGVHTLKTSYLCSCGDRAVVLHGFPGQAPRAFCALHEKTAPTRIEPEPGRTMVASVQRLDT